MLNFFYGPYLCKRPNNNALRAHRTLHIYLCILFMLIHMRFSTFFLPSLIIVFLEHIFMISYLTGYRFEYDRFCTYIMLSLIIYLWINLILMMC